MKLPTFYNYRDFSIKANPGARGLIYLKPRLSFAILLILLCSFTATSQETVSPSPDELKKLSVEELMDMEVTLVSRSPEKLKEVPSAIQVISADDIRHSGATSIPEALRLASNLQVAQLNASAWIISARGFNTVFANKLLVMIDGRTVYTPLFGGVIWDMQHVLLDDVEKIEVISGPGGTLWGANAVNGVINIITKNAKDTQGFYMSLLAGSFIKDQAALRFGNKIGKKMHYKIYGQHFDRKASFHNDGQKNADAWRLSQAGFRIEYEASAKDNLTLQGDWYDGTRKTPGGNSDMNGQNILARWNHTFSEKSDLIVQLYYDRYFRDDIPSLNSDELNTVDLDLQYGLQISDHHHLLAGLGYRNVVDHAISRTSSVGILPERRNLDMFNGFVQDQISIGKRTKITVGTKILHNVYTGLELQPSLRGSVNVKKNNTLWLALSRAVRTPSRYDVDFYLPTMPLPPTSPSVAGGPNFVSEKLLAYELGYRIQPNTRSTMSVAAFYNVYRDIYSVEALPGTLTYQIQNGSRGNSWGTEFTGTYQLLKNWKAKLGYTYFDKKLEAKPGHTFNPDYLGNDAKH
ncbi:MAG: TonB-dependent receptor plug domain-containing protein, partial [Chitinophagaceae bacterium]|nr:TonB-dependent receptor plug domain-containing protein [Chitinophagaceae bacterium]